MSATVLRIIERHKAEIEAAYREGRADDLIRRCVDDLAADAASGHFLIAEAQATRAGPEPSEEARRELLADLALASLRFADTVNAHLGAFLCDRDDWEPVRAFYNRFVELARSASAGGSA